MGSLSVQYDDKMHMLIGPTGEKCHLSPQCHKLMFALLEKAGDVVTRDELRSNVWGHEYVSDDAINHAVARLRLKIKDIEGSDHWYIESLPSVGYRLTIHQAAYRQPFRNLIDKLKSWWLN